MLKLYYLNQFLWTKVLIHFKFIKINSKNTNYKYIIDIIDHFSKYTNSSLLNTKDAYEIFIIVKNFMKINGFPK